MKILNQEQTSLMEGLIRANQNTIKATMSKFLKQKYKKVTETKDYIFAKGDIPIALVAHMDTVFEGYSIDKEVYYDRKKNVMFCPDGAGFDDRAGLFAIIQILRKGLRPHIILTTDEERGAVGAAALAAKECPFNDLNFVIQLDRRGSIDCVFYDCDNREFVSYIESCGFVEAIGSFSDISVLCPSWGVAGVNLSIGYYNEHSISETLNVGHMLNTIDKVIEILRQGEWKYYEYIQNSYVKWFKEPEVPEKCQCKRCKKTFSGIDVIPVKEAESLKWTYYCIDCIGDNVVWCSKCGEAYEVTPENKNSTICEDCYYDYWYGNAEDSGFESHYPYSTY